MKRIVSPMKLRKKIELPLVNVRNQDSAAKGGELKNASCGNGEKSNCIPSPRKSFRRPQRAVSLREYSSVLKTSLVSAVSPAAPESGRVKGRTGHITSDTVDAVALATLKSSRRTFEGGPVSEERFREMQAESYRLKRELVQNEEQRKALVARLNRAENAAKRKLRASVEHISLLPKQKMSALAVLTENYNTEKKVQELEERLRVCRRDNQKCLQYVTRYKAESEWLKRRLDAIVCASGQAKSCSCQHNWKSQEKIVKDLRKQLSSLQKENNRMTGAENQSLSVPDNSKRLTEDQVPCTEFRSSSWQNSGSHYWQIQMKPENVQGSASDPVHEGDIDTTCGMVKHLEETETYGINMQRPTDMVHSMELEVMRSPPEELLMEQSIGDTLSTFNVTSQLMGTWERLKQLTVKYNKATEELCLLKFNHDHCARKLQDTYCALSQERRKCLKLEAVEKRLSLELTAAKHTEALLQQFRQQNVQLENENAELVASALNVPRVNFSELKSLRQQLVDELKQRKVAETKAGKLSTQLEDSKQDLAQLALVAANWEYLKTELAVAKSSASRADQKVKDLHHSNKWLQKQRIVKGEEVLQMKEHTDVSAQQRHGCEEDEDMHPDKDRIIKLETELDHNSTVEDGHIFMEDQKLKEYQTSGEIGLQALLQGDKHETSATEGKTLHNVATFCVDEDTHGDALESLKKMLDSEATAHVQFQVFGEGDDCRPTILLGSCQVDLWAAMYQENATDRLERQLKVMSQGPKPTNIGRLHVEVCGLDLLRDVHGLAMPPIPPKFACK